jgi:hypothetical protein
MFFENFSKADLEMVLSCAVPRPMRVTLNNKKTKTKLRK